jgi:N4-gp56 family major capsid protein
MALGSNHVTNTTAATFIPEIWSDEIIAAYQKSLKMAPLVKKMSMSGKKGDTIHVPKPTRGTATDKTPQQQVNLIAATEDELIISVDRHFEYSRLIEDITEVQALSSMRQFYTQDAGYALATRVDNDLHAAATGFGDGTRTYAPTVDGASFTHSACFYNASGVATPFAADTVNGGLTNADGDAFLRAMIQKLDDNDVPMEDRVLVIPPSARKQIMGIDRYVSTDFVNGKGVETGLIGNLYGIDVYVSSNCGVVENAASSTASTVDIRAALMFHRDAIVMAEQMGVRSQTQYKQEYLSNLFTADTLYGVEVYRPEAGFVLALQDA